MKLRFHWRAIIVATSIITASGRPLSAEDLEQGALRQAEWLIEIGGIESILLVQQEEVVQPLEVPMLSNQFNALETASRAGRQRLDFSLFEPALPSSQTTSLNSQSQVDAIEQILQQPIGTGVVETAPVEIIPASSYNLVNLTDVTESIIATSTLPTVRARRRSPVSFEPRIRGYAGGQIYTTFDGSFIGPVRNDLDGVLSKIDKSLIASTEIISGPYGLRHGSGFAFLTVDTIPTPRYERGWENHVRLGTFMRTNGGQSYNTATLLGGGQRAGFFANVGYRSGSDYESGSGLKIPSSYEVFNLFSGIGVDINEDTRMETKFTRLDQGETEYAAQFFDVNNLKFHGLTNSIIHQDAQTGFGYRIDGWISDTNFSGDTTLPGKRRADFPVLNRVDLALQNALGNPGTFIADVGGDITLAGVRAGVNRQFDDQTSVAAGADIRYVRQRIEENYDISSFYVGPPPASAVFQTGLPKAEIVDPGFYLEGASGMSEFWNIAVGARLAFASTRADESELRNDSNFRDFGGNINRDLDVSDILGSWYINNDLQLTSRWRSKIGVGYAERLPDLTDRYSDGLFLSVIQGGFSRVIGNPELAKERNWQVDLRLDGEFDNARVQLSAFHAWILDYITYSANLVSDPLGARILQVLNTDYATMAGCELYGEADWTDSLQLFGSLAYLDGRDREINRPLGAIYPLEGRLGMRLHDPSRDNSWGIESGLRMVQRQDRLGTVRSAGGGPTTVVLESETPGFAVAYLRGYITPSDGINITGGVENLFNKNYYEHLNLRLPADGTFGQTIVYSPGITPYFGIEVEY